MQTFINQYSVKVYNYSIKPLFLSIFCLLTISLFANNVDKSSKKEKKIKKQLNGGVNLSLLEHYWDNPNDLLKTNIVLKLNEIKSAGFSSVRVPVAFDMFLRGGSTNLRTDLIDKLGEAYNTCHDLDMRMIITYHYGKLTNENGYSERDKILWIWKQIQNKFLGMGYDDLFFELYNEPTIDRNYWKRDITYIVNGLRYEDKNRYYIVGGTNYNNVDELLELGKLDDDKIFYTFHFYDPYIFTHQGAQWTKEKSYITGLPYPYKRRKMPKMPPEARGTLVETNFLQYPNEANKDFIYNRLRLIAYNCKKKNMPLICTETGVINLVPENYRSNYLEDITSILYKLDIPTHLWDYDQTFTVTETPGVAMRCLRSWIRKTR